ncbi:MAG TPA: class I SAM-dependent methyltransferase [Roseiflexaceae bacterium]|nr:class I SAM-dependent methyltransferase [Roseiflexaceae bacterium]HMP39497.1 class I SAM-dependent methyltransferase [Roseiflexaceae bacterium]
MTEQNELAAASSNFRKHTSGNPIQRLLIERFHHTIAELAGTTDAQRVLDAGCGEGFGMRTALEPQFPQITGLDLSHESLSFAHQQSPATSFICGSMFQLPFANGAFDLVVCLEVLEHLDDPEAGLAELCRVSHHWLLLSVPHEPLFRGANFLRGKNMHAWGNDEGHVNHWSARGFARFVSRRCTIVSRRQSFPWTIVLCRKA